MGTLRGKSGETVEMLERRPLDICCVHQTRFSGKSVRMISGKEEKYKLFWMGNENYFREVGIFLAKR